MLRSSVLDTFIFKDQQIYLRAFHIDRTFEAYQQIFPHILRIDVEKIYLDLEVKLKKQVSDEQLVRLVVLESSPLKYSYEIHPKLFLAEPVVLELVTEIKCPAGRGQQNYKWLDRDLWMRLMRARQTEAADVLAQNTLGQVTETSRCNIFIYNSVKDAAFTPTLDSGCINGVYRRYALAQKSIDLPQLGKKVLVERDILADELLSHPDLYTIYLANSARGVLKACLISKNQKPKN
ncbi:MAG: aminotransferase class IV [Bdellovibrionaceae bacterium]|nr:aminotransferase class IV [Bdellovibrio sp.]